MIFTLDDDYLKSQLSDALSECGMGLMHIAVEDGGVEKQAMHINAAMNTITALIDRIDNAADEKQ